ncbi:phage terminase large subunit family protein [Kiloniella sp.]|uniref:phage terminase large subunit family protein n=1 Tax=Kiloniella sp. TaxID=1938587 RepID=UPI003B01DA3D
MANIHLNNLIERAENRFSIDSKNMSMTDWICENTTIHGKKFSVERYPFQRDILDDMHPNMDVKKCSQVGLTEGQIRKMLGFLVRNRGTKGIFTLPNEKLYDKISKTRIQPIVEKDKVFNPEGAGKVTRSKEVMQFGYSWLYVTGCTEADATSTSADAVFNDEVDLSPQDMLALFNSRLQDSDWKIRQRFSTPTFPAFGIDQGFQVSDQHLYLCKCDKCNHWNWPEFNRKFITVPGLPDHIQEIVDIDHNIVDDIDILGAYVHCEKCRAPLDLSRLDNRQWVAKHPNRAHHRGYSVSPFTTERLPPSYIITQLLDYKKREYIRGFHNTVLAQTYSDNNIQISREAIDRCMGYEQILDVSKSSNTWVGIDVGQTCHITLGAGSSAHDMSVFDFRTVHVDNLIRTVEEIMDQYRVVGGTIDRHPYEPTADAVFKASDGKILPAEYRGNKEVNLVNDATQTLTHVQIDRTMALDQVARQVKRGTISFNGYKHQRSIITDHLRNMVRDEKPDEPAKWIKLDSNDHYFHSLANLLVAPKVSDVVLLKSNHEIRTLVSSAVVSMPNQQSQLLGRSNKRVDFPVLGM